MTTTDAALETAAKDRTTGGRLIGVGVVMICGGGFFVVWGGPLGILAALVGLGMVAVGLRFKSSANEALRM